MFDSTKGPAVRATLTVDNPDAIFYGEPFDYALLVTNETKDDVVIPRSLDLADVLKPDSQVQQYQRAYVSFMVRTTPDFAESMLGPTVISLYGIESKPYTLLTLKHGESLRILGRESFIPYEWKKPDLGEKTVGLTAILNRGMGGVRETTNPACDGFTGFFDMSTNIASDNPVEVKVYWR